MRIAQVSPLAEAVPPARYGGTERVVSYLTEGLVARGHEVTLFASGDSRTAARLIATRKSSLRSDPSVKDVLAYNLLQVADVARHRDEFDIIHFHIDYLHLPFCDLLGIKGLTTIHGRLDLVDPSNVYKRYPDHPLVSLSMAQRRPLPDASWVANIPHGLPRDLHAKGDGKGGYLAFVGRVSPEKGLTRAIEIARTLGVPLRIAAKVDDIDKEYFERELAPTFVDSQIEFLGELDEEEKGALLRDAQALLFPIDWPEPFGIVMIEAFACGTPVIAFRRGSVPEIVEPGVSGFIVESVEEAVEALRHIDALSRDACREAFERRFTADRMTDDYLGIYERLLEAKAQRPEPALALVRGGRAAEAERLAAADLWGGP